LAAVWQVPPSVIRTVALGRPLRIVSGSCRVSLPHERPYTLSPDEDERVRRAADLEGWGAFQDSFHRLAAAIADIAATAEGAHRRAS